MTNLGEVLTLTNEENRHRGIALSENMEVQLGRNTSALQPLWVFHPGGSSEYLCTGLCLPFGHVSEVFVFLGGILGISPAQSDARGDPSSKKQRRYVMATRWVVVFVTAVSLSLSTIGSVGAVVCNPLCMPDSRGTDHAKTVANQNGVNNGITTAQQQPGNYKTTTGPCSGC
jgi:hypothetical protein